MTVRTITNTDLEHELQQPCLVCGSIDWHLAPPSWQAKCAAGRVLIRCKTCHKASSKKSIEKNAARHKATCANWYANNKQAALATAKAYKQAHKEATNAHTAKWKKANPANALAHNSARRASKLQRTPPWADLAAIALVYENCPAGMHVDHIVPLRGELVSGLHTVENLQYLTPEQNSSKGNKFLIE